MITSDEPAALANNKVRVERAEARAEQAEARTEKAKSRTEAAETRTEQAEIRTEMAKTRTEQAETRTEQAETRTELAEVALQRLVRKDVELHQTNTTQMLKNITGDGIADPKVPVDKLTDRHRDILRMIAEGQNTKQIADILKVSPKTVKYHRMRLMNFLNIHDVPGLVRFAMQSGLLPQAD